MWTQGLDIIDKVIIDLVLIIQLFQPVHCEPKYSEKLFNKPLLTMFAHTILISYMHTYILF